jgi:hypothetical protein
MTGSHTTCHQVQCSDAVAQALHQCFSSMSNDTSHHCSSNFAGVTMASVHHYTSSSVAGHPLLKGYPFE